MKGVGARFGEGWSKVRGRLKQGWRRVGARFGEGWSMDAGRSEQGSGKVRVNMNIS